jgi:hypothetical protein
MKTTRSLRSALLLLLTFLNPPSTHAQLKAQPHLPPVEQPAATSPATIPNAAVKATIAVVLPKSLDAQKLKPGDEFTLDAASSNPLDSQRTQILLLVMGVSLRSKDKPESRLDLRFERLRTDPNFDHSPILYLAIQAVASPAAIAWFNSPVIVDRFPCDPKVARDGCDQPDRDDVEVNLDTPELFICDRSKPKDSRQPPASSCVPQDESHGLYGYPDLSFSSDSAGRTDPTAPPLTSQLIPVLCAR